jgi:hypothetical protein
LLAPATRRHLRDRGINRDDSKQSFVLTHYGQRSQMAIQNAMSTFVHRL